MSDTARSSSDADFYRAENERNRKHLRGEGGVKFTYDLSDDERILIVRGLLRLRELPNSSRVADLMDKLLDDSQAAS